MKRQNKNSKKIASAASMLLLSTAMLGMATYAWFTMNREVSVTNMQVKARTDQGLLINEVATATDSNWDNQATTSQSAGIELHATSTANTGTWYAAYSKLANNAASATANTASPNLTSDGYLTLGTDLATDVETVAAATGTNAEQNITFVDKDGDGNYDNGEGYYVKYTYYLKSSGEAITCSTSSGGQSLQIANLNVTGSNGSADLDKALRVAVVAGGKVYFFSPLYDTAQSCYVAAGATATTTLVGDQATAITSIPSVTTNGTPVYVYLYFEGEDTNLKTQNVTSSLDNLIVDFKFKLVDNATSVDDNGITVPSGN